MANPALNDNIFERETRASGSGGFAPGWGRPSDEVPPDLFGRRPQASTLPPPPGRGPAPTSWEEPTAAPPVAPGTAGDTMRIGGTMSASAILLLVLVAAGWFGWQSVTVETALDRAGETVVTDTQVPGWLIFSLLGGLALAILTIVKPKLARITAPLYAAAQGLLVGAISKMYEVTYEGIVLQAIGLTIGVFVMMLVLYATGTIRVTDKLRRGIFAATGAVALVYLVSIVLRLFGSGVPMIHEAGPVGILFSLVVVGIASFNLLVDFDLIERGVRMGAPKYMEWYGAFGLMVTLIWLYLELLRLLAKLRER